MSFVIVRQLASGAGPKQYVEITPNTYLHLTDSAERASRFATRDAAERLARAVARRWIGGGCAVHVEQVAS